ncbi:MAG: hypothetical protein K2I79_00265 [Clostridia bacterium]|nr:hypothetical protein [Clostridia bacterium]
MYDIIAIVRWLLSSPIISMIVLCLLFYKRHKIISSVMSVADKVHGLCSLIMLIAAFAIKVAVCYLMVALPHISAIVTEKVIAVLLVTCVLLLIDIVCTLPFAVLALFCTNHFNQTPLYKHYALSSCGTEVTAFTERRVFRLLN